MPLNMVIDASVMAKWFIDEKNSFDAQALMEQYINGEILLFSPSLIYFEVLNALKYSKIFDIESLNLIGQTIDDYGIERIAITRNIRSMMIKISVNYDLSIYDASYVAIALEMDMKLITADRKIKKKLPSDLKKSIIDLCDYSPKQN